MKVFIIAGELSGDKLGAALMEGLKTLRPDVEFHGIGGPMMQAQGLDSLFPMEELSVMGIAEILPKLPALFRRRDQAVAACLDLQPDVLITIDSPDFCLRVARKVKAASTIPTVHYVAPSVWAWRPKRADKIRGVVDHVLALLPFEPPYMQRAGLSCDFVGHPVVAEPDATGEEIAALRQALNIGDAPMLLVLPGSRSSEVTRMAAPFKAALDRIIAQTSDLKVVIPAAAPVADILAGQDWGDAVILDPRNFPDNEAATWKRAVFAAADIAIAASGTVSLELAAAKTPTVIAYDMNAVSRWLIGRMMLVDTVTLVNLVSDTRAVPEFLGKDCTPDNIAAATLHLMQNADDYQAQLDAFDTTMTRLGRGLDPPGLRAAQSVLNHLAS